MMKKKGYPHDLGKPSDEVDLASFQAKDPKNLGPRLYIAPNVFACTAAIKACGKRWHLGLSTFAGRIFVGEPQNQIVEKPGISVYIWDFLPVKESKVLHTVWGGINIYIFLTFVSVMGIA